MYTERENSGLFCAHVFGIEGSFREFQNHALLGNIQDTSAKKKKQTNKRRGRINEKEPDKLLRSLRKTNAGKPLLILLFKRKPQSGFRRFPSNES